MTNGMVELGDKRRKTVVEVDKAQSALIGLITLRNVKGRHFFLLTLTAREMDDTSRPEEKEEDFECKIRVLI
jgi:hypothetical protein